MLTSTRKKMMLALVGLCLLGAAMVASAPVILARQPLPEGKGKQQLQHVCSGCHQAEEAVSGGRRSRAAWQQVVEEMVARGAEGSDEDLKLIVDYLTTNFGPQSR